MNELVNVLGASLPFLLFLLSVILYFQNRSGRDKPRLDPTVKAPLRWNEMEDLRRTCASMPLDRLVPLYCESGLKGEAKHLIAQELKNRGWKERTLETGKTVLVEPQPASQVVQFGDNWVN